MTLKNIQVNCLGFGLRCQVCSADNNERCENKNDNGQSEECRSFLDACVYKIIKSMYFFFFLLWCFKKTYTWTFL